MMKKSTLKTKKNKIVSVVSKKASPNKIISSKTKSISSKKVVPKPATQKNKPKKGPNLKRKASDVSEKQQKATKFVKGQKKIETQPIKSPLKIESNEKLSMENIEALGPDSSTYQRWLQYKKKYGHLKSTDYDMKKKFEEKKPIMHPKLGWGFILSIENDRLQVLFAQGIKVLISNYNPEIHI